MVTSMRRAATRWSQYDGCDICAALAGTACMDLRLTPRQQLGSVRSRPHLGRPRRAG